MSPAPLLQVEVVCCSGLGALEIVALPIPAGSTLGDALRASGLLTRLGIDLQSAVVGVWGKRQPLDTSLRDRDRVEVYRPLRCDPKEARRLRYRQRADRVGDPGPRR